MGVLLCCQQGRIGILSWVLGTDEKTFGDIDSSFSLAIAPWVSRWTCDVIKAPFFGKLSEQATSKLYLSLILVLHALRITPCYILLTKGILV